jgi:PTH1 family peptidyl-tRNA hydrolase
MNKKLIVGLGNYPKEYENTRHNVGFKVIDKLISKLNCDLSHEMFNGIFDKTIINDNEYFIAKPLTYMNLSGEFVSKIMNYLKIDISDIVVICDDINLNIGDIRIRKSGSSGGQNGLKNIIDCLGSDNFIRIRIGIGKPTNNKINLADYVLSKFAKDELDLLNQAIDKASEIIIDYTKSNNIELLMNKYN